MRRSAAPRPSPVPDDPYPRQPPGHGQDDGDESGAQEAAAAESAAGPPTAGPSASHRAPAEDPPPLRLQLAENFVEIRRVPAAGRDCPMGRGLRSRQVDSRPFGRSRAPARAKRLSTARWPRRRESHTRILACIARQFTADHPECGVRARIPLKVRPPAFTANVSAPATTLARSVTGGRRRPMALPPCGCRTPVRQETPQAACLDAAAPERPARYETSSGRRHPARPPPPRRPRRA